jgi:hypothetical protein
MFRKTSRCFFIFCTKKIEDIQELVFCVSARLLWNAGNYRFLYFNLLMIRRLLAAAKPYVAIGDEKLTTKLQKKWCLDFCLQSYISRS